MVKFYEQTHTHAYPFETVTLGWFLRYPNPYSTHVISTDTIDRHFDPETQKLYTARLHLKKSKIPYPIYKLVPTSLLGTANGSGESQSYILERSVVDVKNGVMITESRNLELTGILLVHERQCYRRPGLDLDHYFQQQHHDDVHARFSLPASMTAYLRTRNAADGETDVTTKVELTSRFGQARARMLANRQKAVAAESSDSDVSVDVSTDDDDAALPVKAGFFRSWGQSSIQRTIEAVGLRRTERAVPKSKEGMNVVLERLRKGGLVAVLEGMKRDRELMLAGGA